MSKKTIYIAGLGLIGGSLGLGIKRDHPDYEILALTILEILRWSVGLLTEQQMISRSLLRWRM